MSAREEVLARISAATGEAGPVPPARKRGPAPRTAPPEAVRPALLDLLAARIADYRATVHA